MKKWIKRKLLRMQFNFKGYDIVCDFVVRFNTICGIEG